MMAPLTALLVTLLLLPPVRWVALRFGVVDRPGPRKIHSRPVAYLGGVAVLGGLSVMVLFDHDLWRAEILLVAVCTLGLVDDLVHVGVPAKLLVEGGLAVAAVALGYVWHLTGVGPLDMAISAVWLVGLCNSLNMLDNMDGLTSTVAATALIGMALAVPAAAPLALPLAAALVAFLVVNRPPARMFLGDAGSLVVGLGAGLAGLRAAAGLTGLTALGVAAFPIGVAVFDTALVIVSRIMAHRPVQDGGTDHFSHRLLRRGLSPVMVLVVALAGSVLGCSVAFVAVHSPMLFLIWGAVVALSGLAIWIVVLSFDPYDSELVLQKKGG